METKVVGSRETESLQVRVAPEAVSLRDVLIELVRHEIAAYERRRAASRALQVLTPADLARGVATGVYGREARAVPAAPSEDVAVERALEAFEDGLYFVFVDGLQVEDLEAPISVHDDSTLRLVRLVALAGG